MSLDRNQYRTSEEELAAEFGRVLTLFNEALARTGDGSLFRFLMNEASAKGLNWVEGLEYVVSRRRGSLPG